MKVSQKTLVYLWRGIVRRGHGKGSAPGRIKQLYTHTQYILAKQPMNISLKREGYLEDLKENNSRYSW